MRCTPGIFFAVCLFATTAAQALTADELIAKNIEARGGLKQLAAIQSLRLSGKFEDGSGADIRFMQMKKRGAIRSEFSLQGMTAISAYDGKEAWRISPFGGRKDPDKMSPDDAKELVEEADIDGPLVDTLAKGHKVEYLGTEDVDGTDAHKLKLTRKNGDVQYIYLDPDYFLEIRIISQRMVRGVQQESETDLGDYEKVNGVFMPFSYMSGAVGSSNKPTVTVEKVEVNVPLDDAAFRFPDSKKK